MRQFIDPGEIWNLINTIIPDESRVREVIANRLMTNFSLLMKQQKFDSGVHMITRQKIEGIKMGEKYMFFRNL
jgi:hypothetical protein